MGLQRRRISVCATGHRAIATVSDTFAQVEFSHIADRPDRPTEQRAVRILFFSRGFSRVPSIGFGSITSEIRI